MSFDEGLMLGLLLNKSQTKDWKPPDHWLEVPEPSEYGINLLVLVTDVSTSDYSMLRLMLSRSTDLNTGYGRLSIDWGDGTIENWEGYDSGNPWTKPSHNYAETGQYLVQIIGSENSNFLQEIAYSGAPPYSKLQLAKLGAGIIINNPDFPYADAYGFRTQYLLQYVKMSGIGGIPASCFQYCYSLRKFEISNPLTEIPQSAFDETINLKKIDISAVTSIANYAFRRSGITLVNAPLCNTVGERSFYWCQSLSNVVFADDCTFGINAFQGCYSFYPRPDGSIN